MSKVTALVEVHSHYGVARLEHCKINGCVSLCTRMGLNICVFCAEKLTSTLTCDFLNNVYALTAAVVTLAGITLGILICKVASHSRHNGR